MNTIEYKKHRIVKENLDKGYFVCTATGMFWHKDIEECYRFIDYLTQGE